MQFVPEYSNPLYLEELFEDDWRKNRKIVKELQEIKETVVPIKNETQEN